ncbi:MAG TPA: hypothetical protein VFH68_03780 [Polyangia bacterium]|jgi:hypothetical protein|nr:hypothetical protein [Polyangia bacterium]
MNASPKDNKKTPAWLLERLAQGELDQPAAQEVRARLAAEGRSLDDELAALERSNRELLAAQPRETVTASIRRRAEAAGTRAGRSSRLNFWIAPLALTGSLGLVLLVARPWADPARPTEPAPEEEVENTTSKGNEPSSATGPRLLVYRQRAAGVTDQGSNEKLADGARAARGDLVQLAYALAPDGMYGVLVSIDGAGRVTQHLPEEGAGARAAAPLRALREIHLPSAYELDDAPAFERFVLITAAEPFAVAPVLDAARALAAQAMRAATLPLALPSTFHQTSVLLRKTSKGAP